jgi:phage shock protein PspC (stress-responsive transcriptional regulator)
MTETPPQQTSDRPAGDEHTHPGIDRGHLRNYEQLRRSTSDRKVAGVAGGLGRHLNIDPTILRVLFVVLCFFGGAGFLLYGVAWLLVPEDGQVEGRIVRIDDSTRNVVLIIIGVIAALIVLGHSWGGLGFPWPLPLLVAGALVYLVLRDRDRSARTTSAVPTAQSTGATTAVAPEQPVESTGFAYPAAGPSYAEPPAPPWQPPTTGAAAYRRPKPVKRGPKLFGFTLAALLLALGCLGLYDVAGGHVVASAYPAVALAVIGVMLVVGAFVGRAGGLIALGVVAALALVGTSIGSTVDDVNGANADRVRLSPATAADVSNSYTIRSGRILLDLSQLQDPAALGGRDLSVTARVGEIVVVLPAGVRTEVSGHIGGPGAIEYPDNQTGGIGNNLNGTYGTGSGVLHLHLDLKAGHIEVRNN